MVSPKVTYPEKGEKHYKLSVIGSNLGKKANKDDILLYLDDNIVPFEWIEGKKGEKKAETAYGLIQRPDTQLDFWLPWPKYSGVFKLKVSVEDRISEASSDIIVSKIESKWKAAWLSAFVTLCLLGIPLILVSRSTAKTYTVDGRPYSVLAAFFIDKETDTYSLAKFQFYVWTAVAIFGYVYLALVESLVQGKAVFPEIPENLPGIILISAATGVLASGISNVRGPKGAGEIHPSLGDFITAGGAVVSERFQFFVWTILGAVTFLFFTISSDPATLHDLPRIPESFLQIMGISSLGYLGGKLARKPGPVIDEIQPNLTAANLKLTITGQKLSRGAGLRIGTDEVKVVPPRPTDGSAASRALEEGSAKLVGSTKEEQGEFCKQLVFEIKPNQDWKTKGKHKLTLTNDDGKTASWDYELN